MFGVVGSCVYQPNPVWVVPVVLIVVWGLPLPCLLWAVPRYCHYLVSLCLSKLMCVIVGSMYMSVLELLAKRMMANFCSIPVRKQPVSRFCITSSIQHTVGNSAGAFFCSSLGPCFLLSSSIPFICFWNTDSSIEAPPSLKPVKKYGDLSGLLVSRNLLGILLLERSMKFVVFEVAVIKIMSCPLGALGMKSETKTLNKLWLALRWIYGYKYM